MTEMDSTESGQPIYHKRSKQEQKSSNNNSVSKENSTLLWYFKKCTIFNKMSRAYSKGSASYIIEKLNIEIVSERTQMLDLANREFKKDYFCIINFCINM